MFKNHIICFQYSVALQLYISPNICSTSFPDYFFFFFADINLFGFMRRMSVGIEFAENPPEGITLAVLWRSWYARLVARISTGR